MSYRLVGAVATDVGNLRDVNQDRGFISKNLFAVADGMGGHLGGEVAATLTIEHFETAAVDFEPGILQQLASDANKQVYEKSAERDLMGMGTTLVAIGLHNGGRVEMINIGDSRGYWLRQGSMAQVTRDHSFVGDLLEHNEITEQEALVHPKRNIITRALGIGAQLQIDTFALNVSLGDRFLLCSDGLTDEVSETEVKRVLMEAESPAVACQTLVTTALANGGKDNVTVLVIDVVEDSDDNREDNVPATVGSADGLNRASIQGGEFSPEPIVVDHPPVPTEPDESETELTELILTADAEARGRIRWMGVGAVIVAAIVAWLVIDRFVNDQSTDDAEVVVEENESGALFGGEVTLAPSDNEDEEEETSDDESSDDE